MPWLYFTRRYEHKARSNWIVVYHAGGTYLVSQACAANAVRIEAAVPTQRPVRNKDATRKADGVGTPDA